MILCSFSTKNLKFCYYSALANFGQGKLMSKVLTMPVQTIAIEADYAGPRIDNFLVTRLKNLPKTRIYRLLRKGEVRVNKGRIKPSYRLAAGDRVRLPPMYLEEKPASLGPNRRFVDLLSQRILYEDDGLMIVNKPPGLPVHGGSQINMGVIETLRVMYPKLTHLELAHRLDMETSGCLVLAKKRGILKELHELMRSGQVYKAYLTLTKGRWTTPELRVEASLKKNTLSNGERMVKVDREGKESITVFKPVQCYASSHSGSMLVEAVLHTGRTHQIRVHARHRSHPLAGDEKYGDREFNKEMREYGLKRMFLHSHHIAFTLPSTGIKISVKAPLDEDLQICLDKLPKIEEKHSKLKVLSDVI
jgi:23S rRNA pseudouridine955/2504/2580 synthase